MRETLKRVLVLLPGAIVVPPNEMNVPNHETFRFCAPGGGAKIRSADILWEIDTGVINWVEGGFPAFLGRRRRPMKRAAGRSTLTRSHILPAR
jgi:hypothetical protein